MAMENSNRRPRLATELVVLAAAASAGIHAVLVPEHLSESSEAGGGFVVATVVLALLVVALSRRSASRALLLAAAIVFAALLAAYALAVTTGVPVLQPDPEPVEGVAFVTKLVELAGLAAALLALPSIRTTNQQEDLT